MSGLLSQDQNQDQYQVLPYTGPQQTPQPKPFMNNVGFMELLQFLLKGLLTGTKDAMMPVNPMNPTETIDRTIQNRKGLLDTAIDQQTR